MAQLPIDSRLKTEKLIEDGNIAQEFRPYLGVSSIADPCPRKLWYGFRCCAERFITPRQKRLLERGHREESIIQADLASIGVIHHSDQKEVTACSGHVKGHIDDLLDNLPDAPKTTHLGEYKTHNNKSFSDLVKKGVKSSKPMHYGQMICYMHKLKLTRGLYVAVNKDNDQRYYERISSNPDKAKEYFKRAETIVRSEMPPPKSFNSTYYLCKWCDYYDICHFGGKVLRNCRTCIHGDIYAHGIWKCARFSMQLTFSQQLQGCDKHHILGTIK